MASKLYGVSCIHWCNDNILIYVHDLNRSVWDDACNIVDLNDDDCLLIQEDYMPFFHVLPAIAHNRFISFIDSTNFDEPESILACNFVHGSFFQKGGFNNGLQ